MNIFVKYNLNHARSLPLTPRLLKLVINLLRVTLLKARDRSRKISTNFSFFVSGINN